MRVYKNQITGVDPNKDHYGSMRINTNELNHIDRQRSLLIGIWITVNNLAFIDPNKFAYIRDRPYPVI